MRVVLFNASTFLNLRIRKCIPRLVGNYFDNKNAFRLGINQHSNEKSKSFTTDRLLTFVKVFPLVANEVIRCYFCTGIARKINNLNSYKDENQPRNRLQNNWRRNAMYRS